MAFCTTLPAAPMPTPARQEPVRTSQTHVQHTHWSASECFCRKEMAAGALQVTYLCVSCTNLLMKGARWREDFL